MTVERKVVAIGGGTGLPVVLRCLVRLGHAPTAVVTMADDGGSSGRLRAEFGVLPPGDVRNCLVALAEPGNAMGEVFQHRFAHGEGLAGHAVGNLLLVALMERLGGLPQAIAEAGRLLGIKGRVLPSTLCDVRLAGRDATGTEVFGQAELARADGPLAHIRTMPSDPPAYPEAIRAIEEADAVIIGPGSLFTSILPNFLAVGVADALRDSAAHRVYVCNLFNLRGETAGMDAAAHVDALMDHGLEGCIDTVIVHRSETGGARVSAVCDDGRDVVASVASDEGVLDRVRARGLRVVTADLMDADNPHRHDSERLCRVLSEVL